ncbi:MAG: hypothetical protein ACI85I_002069 [Arenicella sp.]|jgi:hypothetical protein
MKKHTVLLLLLFSQSVYSQSVREIIENQKEKALEYVLYDKYDLAKGILSNLLSNDSIDFRDSTEIYFILYEASYAKPNEQRQNYLNMALENAKIWMSSEPKNKEGYAYELRILKEMNSDDSEFKLKKQYFHKMFGNDFESLLLLATLCKEN